MITKQIGQAMGQAAERHNDERKQKLGAFYKALEVIGTETIRHGESKVLFSGLWGKEAQMYLLSIGGKITLNLTVEGETFTPLLMTKVVNEGDYLAWNLKVRKEMAGPQETKPQPQAQPTRPNKISKPKALSQKAKGHDVTPLDHDTFRVRSSESGNDYFVRLLPNEDGATCDCKWGKRRKYRDNYRSGCSHVQAVYQQIEEQRGRTTSAWGSKKDALRQHRQMADIGDGVVLTLRKS